MKAVKRCFSRKTLSDIVIQSTSFSSKKTNQIRVCPEMLQYSEQLIDAGHMPPDLYLEMQGFEADEINLLSTLFRDYRYDSSSVGSRKEVCDA